jgi:molybdopterin-binding protein
VNYRIGEAAEVLGVSADTVRRWADAGRLATVRVKSGQREVDAAELARFAASLPEPPVRRLIARESARNHFPGIVTRVIKDTVMAQVEIQAGPHRVVSLMSREAADDLALEPGSRAVASVKSTNVVVEVPE